MSPIPIRQSWLSRLLLRCTKLGSIAAGRSLHGDILKAGLWDDLILSNSTVNMYAKCGDLAGALLAFDEMPLRDAVSWNSLINAFSKLGQAGGSFTVLELFREMRETLFPSPFTFAGVFKAVSAAGGDGGRESHCVSVKAGMCEDVFVGSSLLNMYCKMGNLEVARKVFDRMPLRNSVSWATMISGYAEEKQGRQASELLKLMMEGRECAVNEFVSTGVLKAVSAPIFVDVGRQVHGVVTRNGLLSFVSVGNSLVTFYAKCELMDDARRLFEASGNLKNSITWSAVITGYAQNGDTGEALSMFSSMHSLANYKPSEFTFVGVVNACSDAAVLVEGKQVHSFLLKLGYELHMHVQTALVDMYAKCGCLGDAKRGFSLLGDTTDVVLWTSMIGGCVQNSEQEEALSLYGRMAKQGILPNNLTMTSILKACASLSALEPGRQIHARTIKQGFGLGIPIGSSLSTMYAKCGDLHGCSAVFRRIPLRDTVAWNSIISGFSQNGRGEDALKLFDEMKAEGVEPDGITFINLLFACSHAGLVDKGRSLFLSMQCLYGLQPAMGHYACVVDMLSRARRFEEAKQLIDSVPRTAEYSSGGNACLWRIILGAACRKEEDFWVGAVAGERLLELGTADSAAYMLLARMYAAWGRPGDVERVMRLMRLRGVSKDPGCSWVELRSGVHAFVVGELLHPEMERVYEEVGRLVKHMRMEGYGPAAAAAAASASSLPNEPSSFPEMVSFDILEGVEEEMENVTFE